jgi:hypothetical protein
MKTIGQEIFENILAEAGRRMISRAELQNAMGIGGTAFNERKRDPGMMRISEIEGAARLFHMKAKDLVERG